MYDIIRAIVYSRVSTEDQARHGYSLPAQEEAGRLKAEALGAVEIFFYADEGVPGDILNRPGLDEAFNKLKETKIDYFICFDPDRFARKLALQLIATDIIEKAGASLVFVNVEFENTPEGRLFYAMRGAFSEYEKEKIKERSKRGKIQKAKQGKMTHDPGMFGYLYKDSSLIANEEQAIILSMMFNWVANDLITYNAVADRLNAMGIPSPRNAKWSKSTVKRILQNPAYLGIINLNKIKTEGTKNNKFRNKDEIVKRSIRPEEEWIPVNIPQLVDEKLFYKVQEILKDARRKKPGISLGNYLLSGLIVCGVCGKPCSGTRTLSKTKNRYLRYYRCAGKRNGTCQSGYGYIGADNLENDIWENIKQWLVNPETLVDHAKQTSKATAGSDLEYKELLKALDGAKAEKDRIVNTYQKGYITEKEMDTRIKDIRSRESVINARLLDIDKHKAKKELTIDNFQTIKELSQKLSGTFDDLSFEEKKRITRLIVDRILIQNGDIIIYVKTLNLPGSERLDDSCNDTYRSNYCLIMI